MTTKDFILTSGKDNLSLIPWSSHKLNASWVMVIQCKAYTMSRLRKPTNFTAKTLGMEFIRPLATNFTVNGFCCVQQSIVVMQQHVAQYNLHFQYSIQTQTHFSSPFPGTNILLVSHAADGHLASRIDGGLQRGTNGILSDNFAGLQQYLMLNFHQLCVTPTEYSCLMPKQTLTRSLAFVDIWWSRQELIGPFVVNQGF